MNTLLLALCVAFFTAVAIVVFRRKSSKTSPIVGGTPDGPVTPENPQQPQ